MFMSLRRLLMIFCLVLLLGGCAAPGALRPLGSDRDAHGCIASAGYTWCDAKQKCIRAWEEPCEPGEKITACYECVEFGRVVVDFYSGGGASILANGKKYTASQALSASGARYVGEGIMLWDKGGTARLVIHGRESACVAGGCR